MSVPDKALDRSRAVRRVLAGLLVANIAVLVAKATIGMLTGSLAVLGDAVHSSVADAAHTRTDVFITIGVLIGVLFSRRGAAWVDPAIAIVIALLIVRVAYQILSRAVPVLVDERAIPAPTIRQTAQAVEGVKDAYGIRSRGGNAGVRYAEVTIAVDSAANVADAHAIADAVEARLKNELELEEVTVHVEPC